MSGGGRVYRISELELASRLSFFLWSSIPDDELLDIASAGTLRQPNVLRQQVDRMLADPRSRSLATNFAAQWLFLRDVGTKEPDLYLFREFDEGAVTTSLAERYGRWSCPPRTRVGLRDLSMRGLI